MRITQALKGLCVNFIYKEKGIFDMSFINNILYVFERLEHCEIWLPVEYPKVRTGLYQVSSSGRIRNVVTGKVLKDHSDKRGYRIICLATEALGEGMTFKVHRIVATASWEPDEEEK